MSYKNELSPALAIFRLESDPNGIFYFSLEKMYIVTLSGNLCTVKSDGGGEYSPSYGHDEPFSTRWPKLLNQLKNDDTRSFAWKFINFPFAKYFTPVDNCVGFPYLEGMEIEENNIDRALTTLYLYFKHGTSFLGEIDVSKLFKVIRDTYTNLENDNAELEELLHAVSESRNRISDLFWESSDANDELVDNCRQLIEDKVILEKKLG